MPLPETVAREELHLRRIELRGYRRGDGLYDIEARLTDTKTYPWRRADGGTLATGSPLHDMWLRIVVDEDLTVRDVVASTDASPHSVCGDAIEALARLKGLRIAPGWSQKVKELLGGAQGCTHLTELLGPLATTAFQTLSTVRLARPDPLDRNGRPAKIDSCYAFASNREVVARRWPAFYDGPPSA
ncbi:MAG: DUF2889 domain-containing protein [Casimicrobiaceae bacterium]